MKKVNEIDGLNHIKDYYYITTCGKVISKNKNNIKILSNIYDKDGYIIATFRTKYSKGVTLKIHRLVALAFVENDNPIEKTCVNHKDEIKQHNWSRNLEWCTVKYNTNYGTSIKRRAEKQGKKIDQYDLYGNFIKTWNSMNELRTGEKYYNIESVCRGKIPNAYGYVWRYHKEPIDKFDFRYVEDKSIDCYSLDGEYIKTYKSTSDAKKELNLNCTTNICYCCNGNRKVAYGYVWRYKGEPFDKYNTKPMTTNTPKKVNQYSLKGVFIKTWDCMADVQRELGIHRTCIGSCCRGTVKTAGGFIWKYFNEEDKKHE